MDRRRDASVPITQLGEGARMPSSPPRASHYKRRFSEVGIKYTVLSDGYSDRHALAHSGWPRDCLAVER